MKGVYRIIASNETQFLYGSVYWCSEVIEVFKPDKTELKRGNIYKLIKGNQVLIVRYFRDEVKAYTFR